MIYNYTKRVAYYETDMMGIVHHSNYIRWFEEARIEFLRYADLSYRTMEDENIQIPVVSVSCKYKTPAVFDDEVVIQTSIKKYNGIVAEIQYNVIRNSDNAVLVTGESSHCFVDKETFKPVNLKRVRPDMHEKFMKTMESAEE